MSCEYGDFDPHAASDIHGRYRIESNDFCLWFRVFQFTIKTSKIRHLEKNIGFLKKSMFFPGYGKKLCFYFSPKKKKV